MIAGLRLRSAGQPPSPAAKWRADDGGRQPSLKNNLFLLREIGFAEPQGSLY